LVVTVILAIAFTSLQVFEYIEAPFTIADGIYGSTFFFGDRFSWVPRFCGDYFSWYLFNESSTKPFYKAPPF
jgi:cytochrome c oxidase subunit 3